MSMIRRCFIFCRLQAAGAKYITSFCNGIRWGWRARLSGVTAAANPLDGDGVSAAFWRHTHKDAASARSQPRHHRGGSPPELIFALTLVSIMIDRQYRERADPLRLAIQSVVRPFNSGSPTTHAAKPPEILAFMKEKIAPRNLGRARPSVARRSRLRSVEKNPRKEKAAGLPTAFLSRTHINGRSSEPPPQGLFSSRPCPTRYRCISGQSRTGSPNRRYGLPASKMTH